MKKIDFDENSLFLVTGGAGFIGSNLCEKILEMGYRVRCLDNCVTGHMYNMLDFQGNDNFEFIHGTIEDFATCMKATSGVDYVIHEAAMASVPDSVERPTVYCNVNVSGTVNMLEASRRNHVKRFVYASSSAVYGEGAPLPQKEGVEGEMLSPYALSKAMDEMWASLYAKLYGLETYGLRYFNVYGKRQDPNGAYAAVIPKFLEKLLKGEAPTIYGDGTQCRDFVFVDDVVRANLLALKADSSFSGTAFNVAGGTQYTLLEILDDMKNILGVDTEPIFETQRKGDVKFSAADNKKIKEQLGFESCYSFKDGIKIVIDWYKQNL